MRVTARHLEDGDVAPAGLSAEEWRTMPPKDGTEAGVALKAALKRGAGLRPLGAGGEDGGPGPGTETETVTESQCCNWTWM